MSQFSQPGISNPEDRFVPKDNAGALLLFFPTQLQEKVKTEYDESDAIHAKVVRLNDGRVFDDALIFATALITQLKGAIPDGMVLGTLGQGENKKGNPPWLLSPHTAQDVAIAEQWLAQNPRVSQPAAPPTSAAAAPAWGQQASAPVSAPQVTGGWGSQPAPASSPLPSAAGWAAPAPSAPAGNGWGGAEAVAPAPVAPAPVPTVTSSVHPGLVEALRKKGVNLPGDATQATAEGIWAVVQHNPDVVA